MDNKEKLGSNKMDWETPQLKKLSIDHTYSGTDANDNESNGGNDYAPLMS